MQAKPADDVVKFADQHTDGDMQNIQMGGTIIISQPGIYVDPSRTVR